MRPAMRFLTRIAFDRLRPAAAAAACSMSFFTSALAQTQYTIPANSMPWQWTTGGLNSAYQFGTNDGAAPIVIDVSGDQGETVTLTYVSGTVYPGCCGFYYSDANGNTNAPENNGKGASGTYFPSYYMSPYPINLVELVGTFADSSGTIVGTPFVIGDGPTSQMVPQGATQLQLGVNDDIFSDNQGSWDVSVTGLFSCGGDTNAEQCKRPQIIFYDPSGNAINATDAQETVVVGQQIRLYAYGETIASGAWHIDGNPIANYTPRPDSYTLGQVLKVTDSERQQQSLLFYWPNPSTTTYRITYSYTLDNGKQGSVAAKFLVNAAPTPTVNAVEKSYAVACNSDGTNYCDISEQTVLNKKGNYEKSLFMGFGNPEAGTNNIGFIAQVSTDPGQGSFWWVQKVLANQITDTLQAGGTQVCSLPGGLDANSTNGGYPLTSGSQANDSPGSPIPKKLQATNRYFTAQMYLMWISNLPNSIPVPLGSVVWGFNESTQADVNAPFGGWDTPIITSYPGEFMLSNTYPEWEELAKRYSQCGPLIP